jgi:hypothetical protein
MPDSMHKPDLRVAAEDGVHGALLGRGALILAEAGAAAPPAGSGAGAQGGDPKDPIACVFSFQGPD